MLDHIASLSTLSLDDDGVCGLLIAVRVDTQSRPLVLSGVYEDPGTSPILPHSLLHFPFDNRNILWRNAFRDIVWDADGGSVSNSGITIFAAKRMGMRVQVPLERPIPGFPDNVEAGQMHLPAGTTSIDVYRWDHCLNAYNYGRSFNEENIVPQVAGDPISSEAVLAPDIDAVLNKWINVRKEDLITVCRWTSYVNRFGQIRAFTADNWPVLVLVETVHPRGFGSARVPPSDRTAFVSFIKEYDPVELDVDPKRVQDVPFPDGERTLGGILTQRPALNTQRRKGEGAAIPTQCRVHWQVGNGWREGTLNVKDLDRYSMLWIGSWITAIRVGEEAVAFKAEAKVVSTRLLWRIPDESLLGRRLYDFQINGDRIEASVLQRPSRPAKATPRRINNRPGESSELFTDRGMIWGTLVGQRAEHMLVRPSIRITKLIKGEHAGDILADIRIQLEIEPDPAAVRKGGKKWNEWLEGYFSSPERAAVRGRVIIREDQLLFEPRLPEVQDVPLLPVPPDEGPRLGFIRYPDDALAVLDDTSETMFASLRKVPPNSLQSFYTDVMHSPPAGELISMHKGRVRLYYWKQKGDENAYLEFGYGRSVILRPGEMVFNWNEADSEKLMLFAGDGVTAISFIADDQGEQAGPPEEDHVIRDDAPDGDNPDGDSDDTAERTSAVTVIRSLSVEAIEQSDGAEIYSQARYYSVVNLLAVTYTGGTIRIVSVEGFNDRSGDLSATPKQWLHEKRAWAAQRYLLDDASVERLKRRWSQDGEGKDSRVRYILAALDTDQFVVEEGRFLVFSHRRMTFRTDEGAPGLLKHCRVHMTIAEIVRTITGNDLKVHLKPLERLDADDVGEDFIRTPAVMFRRRFSVREDILERFGSDTDNPLIHNTLLVKLDVDSKSGNVGATLNDGLPPRHISVLHSLIANQGSLLGFFLPVRYLGGRQAGTGGAFTVEIQPGVFFRITSSTGHRPERSGELLRILADPSRPSRLMIEAAAFGDERYVGVMGRGAVILPKDSLRQPNARANAGRNGFWADNSCFTVGGLSNLQVSGASRTGGPPSAQRMIDFMCQPFPRIGHLFERGNKVLVSPPDEDGPFPFRLAIKHMRLFVEPLTGGEAVEVAWSEFAFACVPIRVIKKAMRQTWGYHDLKTYSWFIDPNGAVQTAAPYPIAPRTASTGPIFLHMGARGQLTARYPNDVINCYAFPHIEMMPMLLEARGKSGAPSVIACSVAAGSGASIWLEATPGRVFEFPVSLVRPFGVETRNFDWSLAMPGDLATVSLLEAGSPVKPDEFHVNWHPRARGMFAAHPVLLPIVEQVLGEGCLTVGAGAFQFTLPWGEPTDVSRPIVLASDNRVSDVQGLRSLSSGTAALLGVDQESKKLFIHGLPECYVRADRMRPPLDGDPLAQSIWNQRSDGSLSISIQKAVDIIEAVGGALPVTIEGVDSRYDTIFISRRLQTNAPLPIPGKAVTARLLGVVPGSHDAVLLCGPTLLRLPLVNLVEGIGGRSLDDSAMIIAGLKQNLGDNPIWIRNSEGKGIVSGRSESRDKTINVESLAVIGSRRDNISRALNSLHLEVIVRSMENPDESLSEIGLGSRFRRLLANMERLSSPHIDTELYEAIQSAGKAAIIARTENTRGDFDKINAISCLIGEAIDVHALCQAAKTMQSVISVFRAHSVLNEPLISQAYLKQVIKLIFQVDSMPFDLPLNDRLPTLGSGPPIRFPASSPPPPSPIRND